MQSILQNKKECYFTGVTSNLHRHHVYAGSRRAASEKYGFWVWLIDRMHVGYPFSVHNDPELDRWLKRKCQAEFERTHTREEFIAIIGKSYLDGEPGHIRFTPYRELEEPSAQ